MALLRWKFAGSEWREAIWHKLDTFFPQKITKSALSRHYSVSIDHIYAAMCVSGTLKKFRAIQQRQSAAQRKITKAFCHYHGTNVDLRQNQTKKWIISIQWHQVTQKYTKYWIAFQKCRNVQEMCRNLPKSVGIGQNVPKFYFKWKISIPVSLNTLQHVISRLK